MIGTNLLDGPNYLIEDTREKVRPRYKKKNKNPKKAFDYKGRNPQPNYSAFKTPEYVDSKGREYKRASRSFVSGFTSEGIVTSQLPDETSLTKTEHWGTQVFWIRIPIALRGNVGFPDPEGELVELFDITTQVVGEGRTNGVFYEGKKKTGYLILSGFTTLGRSSDPSRFIDFTLKEKKIKYTKQALF